MEIRDLNVVVCPYCGDMWHTEDRTITQQECRCFRCNNKYFPEKTYKMEDWIFNLVKTIKGK